jgi:hypothetical protein
MMHIKFLMRCCCDHNSANEEEKKRDLPTMSKANAPSQSSKVPKLPSVEDISVIAAPSPVKGKDSMAYPKLVLEVLESSNVALGTLLRINAAGLEGSKRSKADGKTFFGSQMMENGEVVNDVVIDEESQGMGRRHFMISFQASGCKYYISDLGDGTGTFIKVTTELVLKEGYIISFGSSHMKVISIGNGPLDKKIAVKFLEGPKVNEDFCFQPSDDTVLIGRMADCRIQFDDSNLSRYQCNIAYDHSKGWVLRDGITQKKSTNGTWLYVEDEFEMYDELVFKAGKTLFKARIE